MVDVLWMEGRKVDILYELISCGCRQEEKSVRRMQVQVLSVEIIDDQIMRLYTSAPHRIAYIQVPSLNLENVDASQIEVVLPSESRSKHLRSGAVLSFSCS